MAPTSIWTGWDTRDAKLKPRTLRSAISRHPLTPQTSTRLCGCAPAKMTSNSLATSALLFQSSFLTTCDATQDKRNSTAPLKDVARALPYNAL